MVYRLQSLTPPGKLRYSVTCCSSTLDHRSTEHKFVVGITLDGGSATVNGNLLYNCNKTVIMQFRNFRTRRMHLQSTRVFTEDATSLYIDLN